MATEPENHIVMDLQPGDIQLINNFHVLHGRTAYEDDRSTGKVRHLKRDSRRDHVGISGFRSINVRWRSGPASKFPATRRGGGPSGLIRKSYDP
jgi:hypothetical protein